MDSKEYIIFKKHRIDAEEVFTLV